MLSQNKKIVFAFALAVLVLALALPVLPVLAAAGRNDQPVPQSLQVQDTQPGVAPVITSTPNPDGSVIHVVGFGQTLIMIANAYGIKLDQLEKQNNISGDIIFEGRKLLIQGSSTPTLSPTVTLTTRPPSATPRPTRTPTLLPTITRTPTATASATPKPFLPRLDQIDTHTLGTIIIGLSGIGLVLVAASFFRKKKS